MLVNHAQAGTEAVAIADASSASHALANSSAILESIQDHQDLVDAQGGKDGERKTCGMMNSISERSPLSETEHHGPGHISPCAHPRPPSHRREARHFFRPRRGEIGSACKLEDDSACLPGRDEGPSDYACAPADSMQSLSLVSAAFSTEICAMASVASATAAPACRAAAGDAWAEADATPMSVPAADSTQLPAPALVQQNTRNTHDVARLVSQLFGSQPGNEFSFGAAKRLKLQSCWPASWRRNLTGLPACPQQLSKAEASKIMHAAVLSRGGATISNVTLDLGKAGILVLQGTSHTELKNVVVEGGILLCHGPQCHLTLTDCTLKGCKLIIAEGATAEVQRTNIQEHFAINDAAFVVSGRGTTVHASDTHVCVGRGFIVQNRAQLTGTGMHLAGVNGTLITAVGTGTEVTLERSNFEFLHDKSNPIVAASLRVLFRGCAATSSDGAAMTLSNCELKAFHRAAHAARHGRIHLEGCVAETFREDGEGVYAQMAHVSLKDSRFVGCGEYGVCVSGGGATTKAHLVAEGCTIEGSRRTVSVQKDEWSSAEIRECVLDGQSVTATW